MVHYLCLTKSYFHSREQANIAFNETWFTLDSAFSSEELFIGFDHEKGKTIRRNGYPVTASEQISRHPVVMVSPTDTALIHDGPEERRKFIDKLLSQINRDYLDALVAYNKLIKQRNAILRNYAETGQIDRTLLEITEYQAFPHCKTISEARNQFYHDFLPVFIKHYEKISSGKESPAIDYTPSILQSATATEFSAGKSLNGPQTDDWHFLLNGHPLKKFASQGQQKSFVFALKLAQFDYLFEKTGIKPILLLDDLFEKLDSARLKSLLELVSENTFGQLFISDTQLERTLELMEGIGLKVQPIEMGK